MLNSYTHFGHRGTREQLAERRRQFEVDSGGERKEGEGKKWGRNTNFYSSNIIYFIQKNVSSPSTDSFWINGTSEKEKEGRRKEGKVAF